MRRSEDVIPNKSKSKGSSAFPGDKTLEEQISWAEAALTRHVPSYKPSVDRAPLKSIAQCFAVLGNTKLFISCLRDFDRGYFQPCFEKFGNGDKNKMTALLLYFLVNECNFSAADGIVFFGKSNDFIKVVRASCMFKDGLSSVHGEYAHALQWCVIGWACRSGRITLKADQVGLVYSSLVAEQAKSNLKVIGEFGDPKEPTYLWDIVCDCFAQRSGHASKQEDVLGNLNSDSFRSPAFLTAKMLEPYGELSDLAICKHLQGRYERKRFADLKDEGLATHTLRAQRGKADKYVDEASKTAFPKEFGPARLKRDQAPVLTLHNVKREMIATHPRVHQAKHADWKSLLATSPDKKE